MQNKSAKGTRNVKGARKLMALLLTFVMVVGIIPSGLFGMQKVKAATAEKIVLRVLQSGTLTLRNKWTTPIKYRVNTGSSTSLAANGSANITVIASDTVTVEESNAGSTFRTWYNSTSAVAFVKGVNCAITSMPSMDAFTTDSTGQPAGNYFFSNFNTVGTLIGLPAGSFDTSKITEVGYDFFLAFNEHGLLTSLPTGSFNTGNINSTGGGFFMYFNSGGALTSLPAGSFNTSKITTASAEFFAYFNTDGALTSLPAGSFNTDGITSFAASCFYEFNQGGQLTDLYPNAAKTKISNTTNDPTNFGLTTYVEDGKVYAYMVPQTPLGGTVTVTGTPTYGQTLTANTSGITPSGATFTYQWYANGTAISGATSSTYKLTANEVGKTIQARAVGTGDYTGYVSSSATAAVAKVSLTWINGAVSNKTYDGTTTAILSTPWALSGMINSENPTITVGNAAFAEANVGTGKTVTFSGYALNSLSDRYQISGQPPNRTANISAKSALSLTVTAPSDAFYDGAEHKNKPKVEDGAIILAEGTDYDLTYPDANYTNVGTKNVTITFKGNYTGTTATSYEITTTALSGSISFDGENKYGGTLEAIITGINPGASYQYTWKAGTVTLAQGPDNTFYIKANGNIDILVGKIITVEVTDTSGGYTGTLTTSSSAITAKELNWDSDAEADDKSYDGNTDATVKNTPQLQGVLGDDAVSVVVGALSFDTPDVGNNKTVTASGFGINGTHAANYLLSDQPSVAPANITKTTQSAPMSVAATDESTPGANDGTISNVDTTMEYKLSADNTWTDVTSNPIIGLAPGMYDVRYKETITAYPSVAATVTINAAVATPPTYINLTVKGSDGTNELTSYTTQIQAGTSTMTDAPTLPNYVLDNTNIANYSDNTLSGVFGKRLINSATDTSHTFVYKKNTASVVVDFIDQATTLTITGQSQQQLTGIIGETLTINAPIIADYELISGEQSTKTAVVGTDAGITFTYERMSGNIIIKAVEQGNTSNVLGMWSDTATVGASYTPTPQNFTGWITPVATAVTAADGMIITLEYTKDVADITVHYVEQGTATTVATDTIMTAQQIGTNVYVIAQPTDLAAGYTISGLPYQTLTVASGTNEVTFEYVRGTGVITILGKYSGNVIHYSTQNANLGTAYGPIAAPNITGYTSGTWDSNSDPVSGTMPAHDITIVFDYALNSTQIPVKVQDPSGNALPGITYQNGLIYKTEAAQIGGSITIYAPHFAGYTIVGASTAPFSNINGSESATFEYVPLAANFVKLTVNANVGATTLTSFVVLVEKNVATTIEAPTVPGYVLDTANDENYSNGDKLTGVFGEYEVNPAADSTHTFYYTKNTASVVVDFIDQATTLTITGQSPQNLSGIVGETLTINAPIIADYELISGEQSTKTAVVGTDASITFTYKKMNGNVLFQYAEDGNTSHILAQTRENVAIGTQTAGLAPNTLPQIPTGWALKSGTGTPSANDATVTANTVITFLLVKEMETITIHYYEDGTTTDVASDTQVSAQLGETLYVLAEPTNLNAGYNLKDLPYQQYTVVSGANEVIFYYEPIVAGEGILTVLGYSGGNVIHYSTQTITAGDPYGTVVAPSISGYKNGTWRNTSDLVSGTMTESGITVIFDYDEDTTDISIIITDEQSNALSGVTYQNQSSKLWKTQTAQTGSDVTIYAPSFVGYTIVGKASEDLTNIQGGASATFTYKTVTTTIPQIDIPIIVVDEQGNTLSGVTYLDITNKIYTTQSVQQGSNITIYAPAIAGFEVVGATSKPIASAQATDDATFVYKAISNVPSPPTDGKLTVIVTIAETGATQQGAKVKINGTEYTTDAGGKVEINPAEFKAYSLEASYSGYNNASANVTLGVANPEQIVYLALGKTTSGGGGSSSGGGGGSSTSTATLKIKCVDEKGNDIFVQSLTTVVGNKETVRALLIDGYKLAQGEPNEQEITIKSGENIVTFKYVKEGDKPTPPPDNGNRIEDMLEMDEHIKYIGGYVENGAALVKPDNSITRAETAMIFFRLLKDEGKNASIDSEFSDVRDDEWFTQAVCYLAKIGILNGYYENGESIFKPNQSITRAEFTAIAQRFDEIVNGNRNPFSDLSDDHWAYFYILSAYEKGWIGGYPDGSFKPGNPITRAEVVTIVNKMLNRKIHKDDIPQELWTKFSDLHSNQWYFADIIEASTEHDYARNDDDWETWTDYEDQSISTNSQPPEPTETPESTPPTPEPPPTEPSPTPPSAEPFADYIIYTVVSGDTLSAIALKYGTTVAKIKELSELTSDILQIGQTLKIPK